MPRTMSNVLTLLFSSLRPTIVVNLICSVRVEQTEVYLAVYIGDTIYPYMYIRMRPNQIRKKTETVSRSTFYFPQIFQRKQKKKSLL